MFVFLFVFFQAEDGIRDRSPSRGLGDVYKRQTVFTQGVAAGLNITEPINSPTFTIIQEYESGRLPLYHFDVYRIGDIEEMEEIGYDDYFFGQGICLIEWANLIEEILPENLIKVTIEKDLEKGFDYRKITILSLIHISEPTRRTPISYAVFCLKKKK